MSLTEIIEVPRRTMVLFFVIDTSGSMSGAKIGAVNAAIEEVIPAIKEISDENADAQIKVAALEFSSGVRWITANGPVELEQFHWNDLETAGTTDLGAACKELNEKLSTKAFMKEASGSFAPVIFLMSDGDPTDDWESCLNVLKQNGWFKMATKVAIAIGDDANMDILKEFTGNMELVLETRNAAMLKKMIKFLAVTSSKVASKSSNVSETTGIDDDQKKEDMIAAVQDFKEEFARDPFYDQGNL